MKYTVKMACGHEVEIQLYGPTAQREKRIAYLEKHGKCDECVEAERKAADQQQAEKDQAAGMPELEGTEKQVAWARKLRADFIKKSWTKWAT